MMRFALVCFVEGLARSGTRSMRVAIAETQAHIFGSKGIKR
jgi:hypothetical protein